MEMRDLSDAPIGANSSSGLMLFLMIRKTVAATIRFYFQVKSIYLDPFFLFANTNKIHFYLAIIHFYFGSSSVSFC